MHEYGKEATNKWLINSGCSNHMTKNSSGLTQLDMGNGVIVSSSGKDTIAMETRKGLKHIFKAVLNYLAKKCVSPTNSLRLRPALYT